MELLAKAPVPVSAARLTRAQISGALRRARRNHVGVKTERVRAALRTEQLTQPAELSAAFAVVTCSLTELIVGLNTQIAALHKQVGHYFERHPAASIYRGQPGLAAVLSARVLAEFGDDPARYADAKARKNCDDQRVPPRAVA